MYPDTGLSGTWRRVVGELARASVVEACLNKGETPMTTAELAKDFTELLKQGNDEAAAAKYNADDIVSYEAMEGPMAVCHGKEAIKQKGDWWRDNHEVHGGSVEGPFVNGDQFAVRFKYDITPKATGERVVVDEVGVYTVKGGKISEERFFY
jgi:ketosteroid isomerase-like protein